MVDIKYPVNVWNRYDNQYNTTIKKFNVNLNVKLLTFLCSELFIILNFTNLSIGF